MLVYGTVNGERYFTSYCNSECDKCPVRFICHTGRGEITVTLDEFLHHRPDLEVRPTRTTVSNPVYTIN